jgi:hypothetical protein
MIKLSEILLKLTKRDIESSYALEAKYAEVNELKIDEFNTYSYKITSFDLPGITKAWEFKDRCGNQLVCAFIENISEFKSGYRVQGVEGLVFDAERLPNKLDLIRPCPDDKRVNTVYKILVEEVIPAYLLNKKPNKLLFNPVSNSRVRLVNMISNKVVKKFPELTIRGNYLVYI